MIETKIQARSANRSAGPVSSSTAVLDFCNQIPIKLSVYLEKFGLKTQVEVYDFLQPKLISLENPYKILNCEKACDRLWNAWVNQETILIYGDYDLDGTSGIILIYESLLALGFKNVHYFQPSKVHDGYGLHARVLENLKKEKNIEVVITVDVGITGNEACDKAKELGIDVIVTDHHLAQEQLPEAFAIVNPNQPADNSGLGYLCGCGVGFYLVRGLCKKWINNGSAVHLDLKSILPYFAIATITDMVPLVKDNRTLLKFAFEAFKIVSNFGLKALMTELNLTGRKLDSADIGLQLAPKINAITRMSANLKPIDLFFRSSAEDAKKFTSEILKLNVERKLLQEAGLQEVKAAYELICQTEPADPIEHKRVFFYSSPEIHHGVTGLIASKMVEQFGGSFFIGAHSIETGVVVGSSRKSDKVGFSLVDLMAVSKTQWIRFGGHASAAGFEYRKDNQEAIVRASKQFLSGLSLELESIAAETLNKNSKLEVIDLDWFDLNEHFYSWVQFLEPFGTHFPEPVFRLKKVPVLSVKVMKEKHFKLNLVNPHNRESLSFVLFFATEEQRQLVKALNRELDICFKIKRDNFNYNQRFQFIVESLQPGINPV